MRLPADIDPVAFDDDYRRRLEDWRPAVVELCDAHGLGAREITGFADGSNLVAAVDGRHVVKIFPPFHRNQWESERRALRHLAGRVTAVRVPCLLAEGHREDDWTYVIVDRLPGVTLEGSWAGLDHDARAEVMQRIGTVMAEVHAVPVGELISLPPPWGPFVEAQIAGCHARHQRLGMPAWFLRGIEAAIADAARVHSPRVLLTGEYTPFNLLLDEGRLSGMFDLGDAMVGPPEYDLLGPSLFLAGGDRRLVDGLFGGYGITLTDDLRRRLLALALLHRYSNLAVQIRIPGWQTRVDDLDDLARLIWP